MSEPFIGEIRIFPYTFAPMYWAYCDGQEIEIAQSTTLFSVIGTNFGGDGRTNFMLPNLKGRTPMHPGNGPGLTPYHIGEAGGVKSISLASNQIPAHTHTANAGVRETPENAAPAANRLCHKISTTQPDGTYHLTRTYSKDTANLVKMSPEAVSTIGHSLGHENRQPFLNLNFCIALDGVYPSRS